MTFDPSLQIKDLGDYIGQVNSSNKMHGIGRFSLFNELYEGQFNSGEIRGFIRLLKTKHLTKPDGSVYTIKQYTQGWILNGGLDG